MITRAAAEMAAAGGREMARNMFTSTARNAARPTRSPWCAVLLLTQAFLKPVPLLRQHRSKLFCWVPRPPCQTNHDVCEQCISGDATSSATTSLHSAWHPSSESAACLLPLILLLETCLCHTLACLSDRVMPPDHLKRGIVDTYRTAASSQDRRGSGGCAATAWQLRSHSLPSSAPQIMSRSESVTLLIRRCRMIILCAQAPLQTAKRSPHFAVAVHVATSMPSRLFDGQSRTCRAWQSTTG